MVTSKVRAGYIVEPEEKRLDAPSNAPRRERRALGKMFNVKIPGVQDVLPRRKRKWYEK